MKLSKTFWLRCYLIGAITCLVRATSDCPSLSLSNGNVNCLSGFSHQSKCFFTCRSSFSLQTGNDRISIVTCRNGRWFVNNTRSALRYTAIKCVSKSFQRSATLPSIFPTCSNEICEGAISGITQKDCFLRGCCWNNTENTCRAHLPSACPGSYFGMPKALCPKPKCYYNSATSSCYLSRVRTTDNRQTQGRSHAENPCETFPIPHSNTKCVEVTEGNYACQVFCDPNYELVGKSNFKCNVDDIFNFRPDWECQEVLCPAIDNSYAIAHHKLPPSAKITCSDKWRVNSTCSVTCPPHHKNVGVTTITCLKGIWSSGSFRCQEIPKCRSLNNSWPSANWKIIKVNCTESFYDGSVCSFSCPSEYKLIGKKQTSCAGNNKRWTSRPPICRKISRSTQQTCNYEETFSYQEPNPRSSLIVPESIQVSAKQIFRSRNSCGSKQNITINATNMQTISLKMELHTPRHRYFMLTKKNSYFYLGGLGSYVLYYFPTLSRRDFNNIRLDRGDRTTLTITFVKKTSRIEVSYKTSKKASRENVLSVNKSFFDNLFLELWLNQWPTSDGSGVCNICVSYTL